MTFTRAFICEECYKTIDGDPGGLVEIIGDEGPKLFNLAGQSRGDRAAIYDCQKWESFQRHKAEQLGIQLP